MEEKSDLEKLKENYEKIRNKYSLFDFEMLNEEFQIEKLAEVETDFLVREIRRFMADKFSNYLRFVEALLHPVNSSMFIFSILKSVGNDEKKKLAESYKKLAKLELDLLELDLKFDDEKEADFVKSSYDVWQEVKNDLLEIVKTIKNNFDNKSEQNGKGYFG